MRGVAQLQYPLQIVGTIDPVLASAALEHSATKRLAPWIYHQLSQQRIDMPTEIELALRQAYLSTLRRNIQLRQALDDLLEALTQEHIPAMPLKGPLLAQRLYGQLGVRPSADLDVLVHPQDLMNAVGVLATLGYTSTTKNYKSFHLSFTKTLESNPPVHLELHRSLMGFHMDGHYPPFGFIGARELTATVWKNAELCQTDRSEHLRLRPEDELLYLCLHLTKHIITERGPLLEEHGASSHHLLLAFDIHLILTRWQTSINWSTFTSRVGTFGLQYPVALALTFVKRCYDTPFSPSLNTLSHTAKWQRLYFIENAGKRLAPFSVFHRPKMQVLLDFLLLMNNWHDRFYLIRWILRYARRELRELLSKPKNLVWSYLVRVRSKQLDKASLEQCNCQVLSTQHLKDILALYSLRATVQMENMYRQLLGDEANLFVGLFYEHRMIGCVGITRQWKFLGVPGYWRGAGHIHSHFRGRGLGKKLARCALDEAQARNIHLVYSNVGKNNIASLRSLKAVGFEQFEQPDWQMRLQVHVGGEQILLVSKRPRVNSSALCL